MRPSRRAHAEPEAWASSLKKYRGYCRRGDCLWSINAIIKRYDSPTIFVCFVYKSFIFIYLFIYVVAFVAMFVAIFIDDCAK